MRIEINKDKAFKMYLTQWFLLIVATLVVVLLFIKFGFPYMTDPDFTALKNIPLWLTASIILPFLLKIPGIVYLYLYFKNLEYSVEPGTLTTRYKIIMEHKSSARLQVVNTVNINQSFWEKLFGLYNVEVDYGFGDTGYKHCFSWLSKEWAEYVSELVQPHSNLGVFPGNIGRKL